MRATIIAIAVSVATIVLVLVAIEVARRRGWDPVARISDVLSRPMLGAGTPTIDTTSSPVAADADAVEA